VKQSDDSMMVWAAMSWYSVCPIVILNGRITAREYVDMLGNEAHPMIQTLFPNNDEVFQDDPIHAAETAQCWFEEHETEFQHLPRPPQSPVFNITESLWSVLEI
jgi:hypothetical protein